MKEQKIEIEFFNEHHRKYFEKPMSEILINKMIRNITKIVDIKNKLVLDAGCGLFTWGNKFRLLGANVIGLDLNIKILKSAKIMNRVKNIVCGDASTIPFNKNSFDIVFCGYLIHHLSDSQIAKTLSNFKYLLKDNGWLIMLDPSTRHPLSGISQINFLRKVIGWSELSPNERALDPDYIKRKLVGVGFKNLRITTMSLIPSFLIERMGLTQNKLIEDLDSFLDESPLSYFGGNFIIAGQKVKS